MQTNTLRSLFILIVLLVASACGGLAGEPDIVSTLPPEPTSLPSAPETFTSAVSIDMGAAIYAENCVRCHGITGAGDGEFALSGQVQNVPDFTDPATIQDKSLQEWFDTITNGKLDALMPPWKDELSATARWSVALYTYTLSYTSTSVTEGQASYIALCADCHAPDGSGTEDGSSLQGLVEYTEAGLKDMIATHQTELELSPAIEEDSLASVVSYVRLLSTVTQSLADPDSLTAEQPAPAATEDVLDNQVVEIPEATGVVRGQIIQGTEGGEPVEGLEAVFHVYDSQLQEQIAEYTVGADGTYQYDDVRIRPDFAYRVTVDYNDVMYSSSIIIGDPEETDIVLDVTIYETTDDSSVIEITSRATQVNLSNQGLYIIEVIDLLNTSDRAFIRSNVEGISEPVSVSVPIPEGAQLQLEHTDPDRILLSDDDRIVFDSIAVQPNTEHYVQFSYLLPLDNASNIEQPTDYTVTGPIGFFIENSHLEFSSDDTMFVESREFNTQTYSIYQVNDTPAIGDTLTYSIALSSDMSASDLITETTSETAIPREVLALVLLVAGVILIGGAAIIIFRNRGNDNAASTASTDESVSPNPLATPEDLMKAIAELDNAFEAGDITKAQYQKQRNQLKTQLMQVMKTSAEE